MIELTAAALTEASPHHTILVAQCRFQGTGSEITILDPTFSTREDVTLFVATVIQAEGNRQAALASLILKTQADPDLPALQNEITLLVTSNGPLNSLLELPGARCIVSSFTLEGEATVAKACWDIFTQEFVLHTHAGSA